MNSFGQNHFSSDFYFHDERSTAGNLSCDWKNDPKMKRLWWEEVKIISIDVFEAQREMLGEWDEEFIAFDEFRKMHGNAIQADFK